MGQANEIFSTNPNSVWGIVTSWAKNSYSTGIRNLSCGYLDDRLCLWETLPSQPQGSVLFWDAGLQGSHTRSPKSKPTLKPHGPLPIYGCSHLRPGVGVPTPGSGLFAHENRRLSVRPCRNYL